VDILALVPFDKVVLLKPGVELELVCGGDDGGFVEEALDFGFGEVGDADGFGFAGFEGGFHGFPRVDVVGLAGLDLAVRVLGHEGVAAGEGGGPVHEVQVHVGGIEVLEGSFQGGHHVIGMVAVVP